MLSVPPAILPPPYAYSPPRYEESLIHKPTLHNLADNQPSRSLKDRASDLKMLDFEKNSVRKDINREMVEEMALTALSVALTVGGIITAFACWPLSIALFVMSLFYTAAFQSELDEHIEKETGKNPSFPLCSLFSPLLVPIKVGKRLIDRNERIAKREKEIELKINALSI